jgi:small subunit ribosomal protein S2e
VKLTPAPRGTGIVAAPIPKKVLQFAGVDDVYTSSSGHTRTAENFIKATYYALARTYQYLSPDLWCKTELLPTPDAKHAKWLSENAKIGHGAKARGDRPQRGRGGMRGGRGRGRGGRGGPRRGSE